MHKNFYDESPYCTEYSSHGTCTFDPSIVSIREIILYYLKQLAYYILKLRELGIEKNDTTDLLVQTLASAVVNADFKSEEFKSIILTIREKIKEYETLYKKSCEERESDYQLLKSFAEDFNINMANMIRQGERQTIKKNMLLSATKRNLHEIILHLLRSAGINICELKSYGGETDKFELEILKLLDCLNFSNFTDSKLKRKIEEFTKKNCELMTKLNQTIIDKYGETKKTMVSFDKKEGKAILVSGHNFRDLELLLQRLKDEDINVYTHNGMILAHSYKKFENYPNLVGHFQNYAKSTSSNFAAFPSAIFITKTPQEESDCFIRGRLFTTALFSGLGIVKIQDDNFEPLIEAAKNSKGFKTTTPQEGLKIGYNFDDTLKNIQILTDKHNKGEISHIVIARVDLNTEAQKDYFEGFLTNLPQNVFLITSAKIKRENTLYLDSHYDFSIFYRFLSELKNNLHCEKMPISIFLSHCNVHTLSHLMNLRYLGIENMYLDNCSYLMINPSIVATMEEFFGIKHFSETLKKQALSYEIFK